MINVTAIKLPEDFDTYKDVDEEKAEFLEPVSKINIFVGSNNSGKSRFMRMLSRQTDYCIKSNQLDLENLNKEILERILGITANENQFLHIRNSFLRNCLKIRLLP